MDDPVLATRVWDRIDVGEPHECWPWTRAKNNLGYGQIAYPKGVRHYAHRLVVRAVKGEVIRHTCDNPPCCNPAHLLKGTQAQNLQDMRDRGRSGGIDVLHRAKTHCPRGHEYDRIQKRKDGRTERLCSICKNNQAKEYRRRRKAQLSK